MNAQPEVLIVLGIGSKDKKPRAATFDPKDAATVEAGAAHMGFKIAWAKTAEAHALAQGLPKGKLYASGDGLVPLVKADTYEKLLKLVTVLDPEPAAKPPAKAEAPSPAPSMSATHDHWAEIKIGSVVLCPNDEKGKDRSWWETTVTGISKNGEVLTLRWTHYPALKPFTFKAKAVAHLPSKA